MLVEDRKFLAVLGLLGVLLSVPRTARANTGYTFLETIGTSTAVGTVLGASTLPFYNQPGSHLTNVALGAGLGALIGVGVHVTGLITREKDEEGFAFSDYDRDRDQGSKARPDAVSPPLFWTPIVSLNW